jgi:peptidoglycan pentaglycine glycine transferase (the first glycine)
MEIREITDKTIWEEFLTKCQEKTFLQSWNWGEFQERMGQKIWRLGIYNNDLIGIALIVKIVARRGTFLLIQHLTVMDKAALEILITKLKEIGKQEGASFVRMAPLFLRSEENRKIFKNLGFKESPMHASAYEATWKLDINAPEDDLMKNMRKTTRYLIRQAQKNPDIVIEKNNNPANLKIYQGLNKEVAKRQNFTAFSEEYIKNEFDIFSRDNQALWFFGKYQGEVAAAALVIFWQGISFYHQAASLSKFAKLSIPYLLQWEAIKEAKSRGCKIYDFWGYTDPQKHPKHPWAGPTLFKMGFGGYNREYLVTQDLPLSKKYWLTYFFEKIRKIKRGF